MQDIKQREIKMQEKRKQTPWRDFVKEICSWKPTVLHKNNGLISRFPVSDRMQNIVSIKAFEVQKATMLDYGIDTDGSDFLQRYQELWQKAPAQALYNMSGENADYADIVHNVKNVYLGFTITSGSENVCYSLSVKEQSKNVYNSVLVSSQSENIYFGIGVIKAYNIFYSKYIYNCSDIWFSDNMIGCHECISCHDMENASYCINNVQLSKDTYKAQKSELLKQKLSFWSHFEAIPSTGNNYGSQKCTGSFNVKSQNVSHGHFSYNVHKGNNVLMVAGDADIENIYDMFIGGGLGAKNIYGFVGGGVIDNIYSSVETPFCANIYYSYYLENCSYCLGCIGLVNKSFCILNKQYTKEERYELANKIFAQMDKDGTLGSFFPASMNPFYFNDTAAYLIDDSFTKEEVEKEGYLRRDDEIKIDVSANDEVITTRDLDQYQGFDSAGEWKINPEIVKKVIKDEKGNYYRIIPMELAFLQKHGLPLPEIHRLERIKLGFTFE